MRTSEQITSMGWKIKLVAVDYSVTLIDVLVQKDVKFILAYIRNYYICRSNEL
jgi:L-arabinose isomerase